MVYQTARRIVVFVMGATIVLIGIVMIVAPGPAMVVIPAGLAILGTEFLWARRLLNKLKSQAQRALDSCGFGKRSRNSPPGPNDDRPRSI